LWDEFMGSFGRKPKHCRACGKRFFVAARKQAASEDAAES
jgi:hypothetical protein